MLLPLFSELPLLLSSKDLATCLTLQAESLLPTSISVLRHQQWASCSLNQADSAGKYLRDHYSSDSSQNLVFHRVV